METTKTTHNNTHIRKDIQTSTILMHRISKLRTTTDYKRKSIAKGQNRRSSSNINNSSIRFNFTPRKVRGKMTHKILPMITILKLKRRTDTKIVIMEGIRVKRINITRIITRSKMSIIINTKRANRFYRQLKKYIHRSLQKRLYKSSLRPIRYKKME
jgi:hypothetical protein